MGQPGGKYTGWLTKNGKTYYYSASTHKPVTGIQTVDGKLYYFDADGVMQKNVNFGIDVSKYQTNIDWDKIKKAGVNICDHAASATAATVPAAPWSRIPCSRSTSPTPATPV